MSALAGTIAAPMAARHRPLGAAFWLRSVLSLLVAVGILAVALPVAFGSASGGQGGAADPLRVFSSGPLTAPQVGGVTELSVAGMVPGQTRSATIRVANPASGTVALTLGAQLSDRPVPVGGGLTEALMLRIESATGTVLYGGPIGQMPDLRLGELAAGAQRAYRFTVSLPAGVGNQVAGSSLGARFAWSAS